ncbi:MAG: glycosyltransferase family 9 protein, partial [Deltaproteobacteria bacterium]|nr:glycosyltransferase family 9 protein [Deltaproteobacteria bacterium]
MRITLQRQLDRTFGSLLCRILSLFPRVSGNGRLRPGPEKILVIILSEMGSLVLAKPMFDLLGKTYPKASVHALVFEQNREVLELLDVVPPGNILTVSNRSLAGLLWDSIRVLFRMHRRGIDAVLDCELFSRISSIYSFLSGAGTRVGFHPHTQEGLYRGDFINRPVLYNPYHHISEQFVTLVEALESREVPTVKRRIPRERAKLAPMAIDRDEIEALRGRLRGDFPRIADRRLVLVYPGGGLLPIRAWPLHYFCRVARDLVRNGYAIGVIGMEEDRRSAGLIREHCGNEECVDLTGYTKTIRELMTLFHL